jgi:cytochrome oxidase Cu insertion factor (SCO1/SenC/PrrC family)
MKVTQGSLLVALVLCSACIGGKAEHKRAPQAAGLADLPSELVLFNQRGQKITLSSLLGRPALVAFIDTNCNGVCQATTNNLHRVADELGPEQGRDIQFILITYDPLFDGPSRLARYAGEMKLDSSRWMLLTGAPDNIDRILLRFGLPPTGKADNPMLMMNQLDFIFLVARDGRIINKYFGPQLVIANVSRDTRAVLDRGVR